MKYVVPALLLGLAASSSHCQATESTAPTNIVNADAAAQTIRLNSQNYRLVKVSKDNYGEVAYYRGDDFEGGATIRTTKNGETIRYVQDSTGSFLSLGNSSQAKLKPLPQVQEKPNQTHSQTLQLPQSVQSISEQVIYSNTNDSGFVITDNEVTVTIVTELHSIKNMWSKEGLWGLTPDQQMMAGIDRANLVLLNSGITEFSFKLAEIVYLDQWPNYDIYSRYLSGDSDNSDNNIALAMAKGNADRILFLAPSKFFSGGGLGLAPQWQFDSHDPNQGVPYSNQKEGGSRFFSRTTQIHAGVLPINVVAHELGHTLGLGHEREISGTTYDFATPYGYTSPSGYATVMSYGVSCDPYCAYRADSFSNPEIKHLDEPLGIADTEVDAADATSFLKKTWPMTTYVDFDFIDLNQQLSDDTATLSWAVPHGLLKQTMHLTDGECPSLPVTPSSEKSPTLLELGSSTDTTTITLKSQTQCALLMGEYNHNNTRLYRPLGMRNLPSQDSPINIEQQTYALTTLGSTISIPLTLNDTTLANGDIVIQAPALWKDGIRFLQGYNNLSDTFTGQFLTATLSGTDSKRLLTLQSSTNVDDYKGLFTNVPYENFMIQRLPLSVKDPSGSTSYFDLDFSQFVKTLPEIKLDSSSVAFKYGDEVKTVTATLSNVQSVGDIVISRSVSDSSSSWTIDSTHIESLGDLQYRVSVTAKRPEDGDSQHAAKIAIKNTGIQAYANFVLADWEYLELEKSSYQIAANEPLTLNMTVYNKKITVTQGPFKSISFGMTRVEGSSASFSMPRFDYTEMDEGKTEINAELLFDTAGTYELSITSWEGLQDGSGYGIGSLTVEVTEELADRDGDGINNDWELANFLDPNDSSDANLDKDGDGLSNLREYQLGTTPHDLDTDNDGVSDGIEVNRGFDPLDATKFPNLKHHDFNGNGKSDVLWRNQTTGQNWLWTMNGLEISESKAINTIPLDWDIVGSGDFDGNGKSDILWRNNQTGRNWMYLMDGRNLKTSREINYIRDQHWQIKAIADFNGDGKDDIFWHHQKTGQTWMYLMDGYKIADSKAIKKVSDLNWQVVTAGDFNGDGKGDVIWRHQTSGASYIYLMDGTDITSRYTFYTPSITLKIAGSGDFNGDGTDDLVWRDTNSGRNEVTLVEDGRVIGGGQINHIRDSQWAIKNVADYDGDGKADIFWHHQGSGKSYIYLMDGSTIRNRGFAKTVSVNWQVMGD